MKLSEWIEFQQNAIDKYGDMEIISTMPGFSFDMHLLMRTGECSFVVSYIPIEGGEDEKQ